MSTDPKHPKPATQKPALQDGNPKKKAQGDAAGAEGEKLSSEAGAKTAQLIKDGIQGAKDLVNGDSKKDDTKKDTKPADAKAQADAAKKEAEEKAEKEKKEAEEKGKKGGFLDNFPLGNTIGGLIGALGGWFVGSMFGGGTLGKIVGAMLAVGGFFMGRKGLGGKIDAMLGRSHDDNGLAANNKSTPEQQKTVTKDGQQPAATTAASVEMDAKLAAAYHHGLHLPMGNVTMDTSNHVTSYVPNVNATATRNANTRS